MEKISVNKEDKRILLPLIFIPCILIHRVLDNDVWFLLNSGRYVVNFGIPHIEPFTIHENMEFVMQQWLTSVIYWTAYKKFGETGIFIIIMVSFGLIIFLMYKIMMLISESNFLVSYSLTLFFSILAKFFMVSRPMAFTMLMITLEIFFLEYYIVCKNPKILIALPVISLIMVNLHASMWPMLFIILVPYIIDSLNIKFKFIKGQGYKTKYLLFSIILMIAAAFINPYGIKSMTYLFRSYGYFEISTTIVEMLPPNINNAGGLIIYLFIFSLIMIYCFYRKGISRIRYFLLTIGTCIMALSSVRNFPFLIICSIFPLSYYLKNYNFNKGYKKVEVTTKTLRLRKSLIIAILIVTVISFTYMNNVSDENEGQFTDLNNAIGYITANVNKDDLILYTGYGEGALAQFKGLATYIDPRAEVFVKKNNKKDDIMKEYADLQNGNIYYKNVLDKYKFTHLLVSNDDILNTFLPYDSDYEITYENESYKIFVRAN